jgi:hypothetical protein
VSLHPDPLIQGLRSFAALPLRCVRGPALTSRFTRANKAS